MENFFYYYISYPSSENQEESINYKVDNVHVDSYINSENEFSNSGSREVETQDCYLYKSGDGKAKVQDPNSFTNQYSDVIYLDLDNELPKSLEDSINYPVDYYHASNSVISENELSSNGSSDEEAQNSYSYEYGDGNAKVQDPNICNNQYSDVIYFESDNKLLQSNKYSAPIEATNQSLHKIDNWKETFSQVHDTTPSPPVQVLEYNSHEKTLPLIRERRTVNEYLHQCPRDVPQKQKSCTCNQSQAQRRKRTKYSPEQKAILEKIFSENHYIKISERKTLSRHLNIDEKQIKVWFQNRRQKEVAKERNGVKVTKDSSDLSIIDLDQHLDDLLATLNCSGS